MGMIGNTLAQGLISGANIQDGTVDTVDIKDGAVTTAKLADGAVATVDIANGAVTPAKLSTGALTWDSSGNHGIGVASPSFQLDLGNGTTVNNRVRLQRGSDDTSQYMTLGWNNISVYRNVSLASAQTDFALKQVGSDGTRTALYVDSSGNFNVGLTGIVSGWGLAPKVQVKQTSTSWAGGVVSFSSANENAIAMGYDGTNTRGVLAVSYAATGAYSPLAFDVGGSERVRISTGGNVGINTTSPSQPLHIVGGSSSTHLRAGSTTVFTDWGTDATGTWLENTGTSTSTRAIRVQSSDGSNNYSQVIVSGGNQNITFTNYSLECAKVERATMNGGWGRIMTLTHTFPVQVLNSNSSKWAGIGYDYSVTRGLAFWTDATSSNVSLNSPIMQMGGGSVAINGSLSKSSGSFRIDHPLPQLTETHDLVHSFVEAPQADNLYRGKVTLVDGVAAVNIDTAASMTDGTFVLLNREVQCFTTNETGWVHVRGSVTGNLLTIEAQDNTCTDTISWMVVGERKDKHMYDTDWTDENGKVIVEPLKDVRPEPAAEEGAPE